jgi:DNA polymerase III subunit gamma/tau
VRIFNQAGNETRGAWQPSLPLEMAFVEALRPEPQESAAAEAPAVEGAPAAKRRQSVQPAQKQAQPQSQATSEPEAGDTQGSAPAGDQAFRQITEQWRQIIGRVGQHSRQTQALLNSCKPFGMKDGVLFLGFNGDFAKSKMEKDEHLEITRKALSEVLEKDVPVRCLVTVGGRGTLPPDVDSDGMVAAALRDLGGEIVDVQ